MRVLVTGGRDYADRARVFQVLDELHFGAEGPTGTQRLITLIIHGACGVDADRRNWKDMSGADRWAHEWANERQVRKVMYPAFWSRWGAAAGPWRNGEMLACEHVPSCDVRIVLVVAFPGGKGTADMVRRCRRARIDVMEVSK